MPRDINDVLIFRGDISPFLVHMTRDKKIGTKSTKALASLYKKRCYRSKISREYKKIKDCEI
jgi:hypothetical protein